MSMTLDQALALCEHASPMPHLAGQALRVLRDEIVRLNELADRFSAAINEMTGPTFMGEPVIPHRDDEAVDRFARAMKDKLAEARAKGRSGWQDKDDCTQQRLSDMLRAHVAKGDPRDVANFCMFLHQRGEAILPGEPVAQGEAWRTMETAPRDGTMLRLLVDFTEHATEDSPDPAPTIGANNFENDEEDRWLFAGWCWEHDHFTQGEGTPVGWLPMLGSATSPEVRDGH